MTDNGRCHKAFALCRLPGLGHQAHPHQAIYAKNLALFQMHRRDKTLTSTSCYKIGRLNAAAYSNFNAIARGSS
jgi:hypothetical protein